MHNNEENEDSSSRPNVTKLSTSSKPPSFQNSPETGSLHSVAVTPRNDNQEENDIDIEVADLSPKITDNKNNTKNLKLGKSVGFILATIGISTGIPFAAKGILSSDNAIRLINETTKWANEHLDMSSLAVASIASGMAIVAVYGTLELSMYLGNKAQEKSGTRNINTSCLNFFNSKKLNKNEIDYQKILPNAP